MRLDSIVPFTVELVALDGHFGQFLVCDFDTGGVGLFVELSPDTQAGLGGCVFQPIVDAISG